MFLSEMLEEGTKLKLSTKFHLLVTSLLEESRCGETELHVMSSSGGMSMTTLEGGHLPHGQTVQPESEKNSETESQGKELSEQIEMSSEKAVLSGSTPPLNSTVNGAAGGDGRSRTDSQKRLAEDETENCKRQKVDVDGSGHPSQDDTVNPPLFYLSLEKRKNYPNIIMPK